MKIALRLAACFVTTLGALWPTAALSDEAALKRTAPDECIAWFSWAGLDALAKGGDKSNRTEQLLADEEVRALFDSIAQGIKVASQPGTEEEAQLTIKLFETIAKRPAVGFLSKIAQVKQHAPPKASEPVALPPATATIVPTTKVTVGADGLERIGVDFDVQVTAGDAPAQPSVPAPVKFGATRTTIVDGKELKKEVEIIGPHGSEWIGVDFDFDLNAQKPENMPQTTADNAAVYRQLAAKLQDGFQAPEAQAPASPKFVDLDAIVHETRTGKMMIGRTSAGSVIDSPAAPAAPAASTPPAPAAPPVCTTCEGCQTCRDTSQFITVYQGAIIADLGPSAADMRAYYDKLESQGEKLPREKIADVEFIRIDMDQPLWLAFHEAYAIVAFDKASAEQVLLGLAGKREIPKWLVDAEAKLPVERPAARLHINIDSIAKLVDEPFEAPSQELVKSLGLDQVSAISFVAGLDDHGTAVKTLIATRDGANVSAVLDIFGDKGLAADDLKNIPKDSTFAAAGKLDIDKLFHLGLKLATIDDKEAGDAWEQTKKYIAEQFFIDFSKDILAALGDTWTIHSSPSEGGLMATTFTLAVRDEAKLKSVIEKLAVLANAGEKVISRFKYRDQDVYYFNQLDAGIMVSWCIKDGRLVASMLPQTIKAHIARGPVKESLAEVARVKQAIENAQKDAGISLIDRSKVMRSNLYVLTYTDTPAILRWCYQYGSFLLPTIGAGLNEMTPADGPKFELHEIPSLAVIEHYFEPSITTFSRTDNGLLFDSRQTVPMISGLFGLTAFSTVGGAAIDGTDLSNVVDMASAVVDLPMGIAAGMSGGGCSDGSCGTPPSPFWMQSDVQYFAPSTDTPPPLPPGSQPAAVGTPSYSQPVPPAAAGIPVYSQPIPPGTPVPYAPSIPGQPYPPPPASPTAAAPSYSSGPPPVAMPQVNPGYAAPGKPLPMPVAPNVPLSVPAGLAPHVKAVPMKLPPPVAPSQPAVLQNIPAGKLWQGRPAVAQPIPGTVYPESAYTRSFVAPPVVASDYPHPGLPTHYAAPAPQPQPATISAPVFSGPGPSIISTPRETPASQTPVPIIKLKPTQPKPKATKPPLIVDEHPSFGHNGYAPNPYSTTPSYSTYGNPYATTPAAKLEAPPSNLPAAKPSAESKPAAAPAPETNSRPPRRLLRRRAAVSQRSPFTADSFAASATTNISGEDRKAGGQIHASGKQDSGNNTTNFSFFVTGGP